MHRIKREAFERGCKEGRWEANSDVSQSGIVEVRRCRSNRRHWVRVEG